MVNTQEQSNKSAFSTKNSIDNNKLSSSSATTNFAKNAAAEAHQPKLRPIQSVLNTNKTNDNNNYTEQLPINIAAGNPATSSSLQQFRNSVNSTAQLPTELPHEDEERLGKLFNALDRDGNGRIDIHDLSEALREFGLSSVYAEVSAK